MRGVSLGRNGAPGFGSVQSQLPILRSGAAGFNTAAGFGLYGSTSMVRALIIANPDLSDTTVRSVVSCDATVRGWQITTQPNLNAIRLRWRDSVGTQNSPTSLTIRAWPKLTVCVWTWDGSTYKGYTQGNLTVSQAFANGITPANNSSDLLTPWNSTKTMFVAHFLGSDSPTAFLDDAGVAAWFTSVQNSLKSARALTPWTNCERWWDAGRVNTRTKIWVDSIGSISASQGGSFPLIVSSLPASAIL